MHLFLELTPDGMRIFSWNGMSFSQQTSDQIRDLIARATGPIALPISSESMPYFRKLVREGREVDVIRNFRRPLPLWMLAVWAISEGKTVIPLHNAAFRRIQEGFGKVEYAREAVAVMTNDHSRVKAIHKREMDRVFAKQMLAIVHRWKMNPPELVFAEDNVAITLGKITHTRVYRLTTHSKVGARIARRVMTRVHEELGKPPYRKNARRRVVRAIKRKR